METINILLVEPNESIADLITKSLQRAFDAEVVIAKTSNEAMARLNNKETFSLIISRNQAEATELTPLDPIAGNLLNTVYDLSLQTPLIIIGEFEHTYKKYALVSDRLRLEEINRLVLKALGLKREDFEHLKLPDYVAFSVKHFYLMNHTPCDVYIRLVKKTGDEYIKRLGTGEGFDKADLRKYEDLGVADFYILKEEYEGFMNALFTQTMNSLKKNRTLEENIEVAGDSFVISSHLMRGLGITPVTLAMVDQTVNIMKTQIQKSDRLAPLLKKLLDNRMSYTYRHSYLICALSYTLFPKMEWGSGDQQNMLLEKIAMVSYFHDLYLEDEKLVKISSAAEMKKANLTSREQDVLLNHAHHAATLVQTYPRLPQGVDIIIKQHHGSTNGVGFPEVLTASISPLAIFFMVVEEFAVNVLAIPDSRHDLAQAMREALLPLKEKYQLPSYRKVVTEIENLVSPKK